LFEKSSPVGLHDDLSGVVIADYQTRRFLGFVCPPGNSGADGAQNRGKKKAAVKHRRLKSAPKSRPTGFRALLPSR
jgi:hypothetical protein